MPLFIFWHFCHHIVALNLAGGEAILAPSRHCKQTKIRRESKFVRDIPQRHLQLHHNPNNLPSLNQDGDPQRDGSCCGSAPQRNRAGQHHESCLHDQHGHKRLAIAHPHISFSTSESLNISPISSLIFSVSWTKPRCTVMNYPSDDGTDASFTANFRIHCDHVDWQGTSNRTEMLEGKIPPLAYANAIVTTYVLLLRFLLFSSPRLGWRGREKRSGVTGADRAIELLDASFCVVFCAVFY